jgi:hypothetical protein
MDCGEGPIHCLRIRPAKSIAGGGGDGTARRKGPLHIWSRLDSKSAAAAGRIAAQSPPMEFCGWLGDSQNPCGDRCVPHVGFLGMMATHWNFGTTDSLRFCGIAKSISQGVAAMGLDAVELVMSIEETFQVHISEEDSAKIITVDDCYQFLLRASPNPSMEAARRRFQRCTTACVFYELRRALMETAGATRSQIRPTARLDALISKSRRKALWTELGSRLNWKLPSLRLPRATAGAALSLALLCIALAALWSYRWTHNIESALFVAGVAALAALACRWIDTSKHTEFAPSFADVGGLAKSIVLYNTESVDRRFPTSAEASVWEILCRLISNQVGCPAEAIRPEMCFVGELGF